MLTIDEDWRCCHAAAREKINPKGGRRIQHVIEYVHLKEGGTHHNSNGLKVGECIPRERLHREKCTVCPASNRTFQNSISILYFG